MYVSLNGATEVASWTLLHSDSSGEVTGLVATRLRQGFETMLVYNEYASHVVADALDKNGTPLGRLAVVKTNMPDKGFNETSPAVIAEALWLQKHTAYTMAQTVAAAANHSYSCSALDFWCL